MARSTLAGSYSATWRLMEVDPATWADSDEVLGIVSACVNRDATGELLETGTITAESAVSDAQREMWGRIELLIDRSRRYPIATMLLVPSPSDVTRDRRTMAYDGYSVLQPAADRHLPTGSYIPAGADGAAMAVQLVSECTPAPVSADGSFKLSEPMVFAQGTTYLEAAWALVDAAAWCVQIEGDGSIHIRPMPTEPALEIDDDWSGILGTEIHVDDGLSETPNQYVAVDGTNVAIATDDDPDSPTSTVSRNGRIVQVYDDEPTLVDGENLEAYAQRKLADATRAIGTRSYTRAWLPNVNIFDVVKGTLGGADLVGTMRVIRQSFEIGGEIMVSEDCEVLR